MMNKSIIITLVLLICCFTISYGKINNKKNVVNEVDVGCDLCEITVSFAEYLVKTNTSITKQDFEADLKKMCLIVPANITKECDLFMLFAAPVITDAIFKGENASTICTTYKMCTVTPSPSPTSTPTSESEITIDTNNKNRSSPKHHYRRHFNRHNNNNNKDSDNNEEKQQQQHIGCQGKKDRSQEKRQHKSISINKNNK